MIASNPEKPITPVNFFSRVTKSKIIITFILSRRCTFLKKRAKILPKIAPAINPKIIDVGIFIKSIGEIFPPEARPVKAANKTITKTSSTEAPAIIN